MSKFGGFFARKAGLYDKPAEPTPSATPPTDNPLELDEELFTALGAQLGGENESLRNLLLDANAKISELDNIKSAVGRLVDPVSKALRAFEAEKSEKISLQTVLNNTRAAYGKLRNEVAEIEKKANLSEKECQALRRIGRVHGDVGAAGLEDAEQTHDELDGAVEEETDADLGPDA